MYVRDLLVEFKRAYSTEIVNCTSDKQVKEKEDALADKIKLYEQQIMHLVYQSLKMMKMKDEEDRDSFHTDDSMEEPQ